MSSEGKTVVLITGANTGIGYEAVRALALSARSYHVFLGSRSVENGKEAADAIKKEYPQTSIVMEVAQIDVSSDDSINSAFQKVEQSTGYIDVLINNAGHSLDNRATKGELTMREAWNQMFDVNVSGAQVLTHKFVPLLLKSSDPRLVFLTSGLAQLETMSKGFYPGQHPKAGWPKTGYLNADGYRTTKTGLNMMMLNWHWVLKEDGVKVWSLSPGMLATNLGGMKEKLKAMGAGDPSIGGNLLTEIVEGKRDADVGKVVNLQGVQPF
ncbi:hypothetical protein K4F52_008106 [Lecanicillium sp. MT-2017a]|nr:hypothetical protein K4F52_008106 [Lecanicillium sp. MT-2017a]